MSIPYSSIVEKIGHEHARVSQAVYTIHKKYLIFKYLEEIFEKILLYVLYYYDVIYYLLYHLAMGETYRAMPETHVENTLPTAELQKLETSITSAPKYTLEVNTAQEKKFFGELIRKMYPHTDAISGDTDTELQTLMALLQKRAKESTPGTAPYAIKEYFEKKEMLIKEIAAIHEGLEKYKTEFGTLQFDNHMQAAENWNAGPDEFAKNFPFSSLKQTRETLNGEITEKDVILDKIKQDPSAVLREFENNLQFLHKEFVAVETIFNNQTEESKGAIDELKKWWNLQVAKETAENTLLQPVKEKILLNPTSDANGQITRLKVKLPLVLPVNIAKKKEIVSQIRSAILEDIQKEKEKPKNLQLANAAEAFINTLSDEEFVLSYDKKSASVIHVVCAAPKQEKSIVQEGQDTTKKVNIHESQTPNIFRTLNIAHMPKEVPTNATEVIGKIALPVAENMAEERIDELSVMEFMTAEGKLIDISKKEKWLSDGQGNIVGFEFQTDDGTQGKALLRTPPYTQTYKIPLSVTTYDAYKNIKIPSSEVFEKWLMPSDQQGKYTFYGAMERRTADTNTEFYNLIVRAVPKTYTASKDVQAETATEQEKKALAFSLLKTFSSMEQRSSEYLETLFKKVTPYTVQGNSIKFSLEGATYNEKKITLSPEQTASIMKLLPPQVLTEVDGAENSTIDFHVAGDQMSFIFNTKEDFADGKEEPAVPTPKETPTVEKQKVAKATTTPSSQKTVEAEQSAAPTVKELVKELREKDIVTLVDEKNSTALMKYLKNMASLKVWIQDEAHSHDPVKKNAEYLFTTYKKTIVAYEAQLRKIATGNGVMIKHIDTIIS